MLSGEKVKGICNCRDQIDLPGLISGIYLFMQCETYSRLPKQLGGYFFFIVGSDFGTVFIS